MSKSPLPDNIPPLKDILWGIAGEMSRKTAPKYLKFAVEPAGIVLVIITALGFASAPFKILLRKNFGPDAISLREIIAGALFFFVAAFTFFDKLYGGVSLEYAKAESNYIIWSLFLTPYILNTLGIIVLIKGWIERSKASKIDSDDWIENNFRGEPIFFKKRIKSDKTLYRTWKRTEPGWCLLLSIVMLRINAYVGLVLIISTLAFYLNEYRHVTFKWEKLDKVIKSKNEQDSFGSNQFVNSE